LRELSVRGPQRQTVDHRSVLETGALFRGGRRSTAVASEPVVSIVANG